MMRHAIKTIVAPPVAICQYSCADCCAAPIGVLWLTGIISIVYGLLGGPANLMGPSWITVGLGLALWGVASLWTAIAIRGYDEDKCSNDSSTLCRTITPDAGEPDSFDEVRKAR